MEHNRFKSPGRIRSVIFISAMIALLFSGCLTQDTTPENTTTVNKTTTTYWTIQTTTTQTEEPSSTTTTTTRPDITTTTTSTSTTVIYHPTTTIADALCYMNSDCGQVRIEYICGRELSSDQSQPKTRTEGVSVYKQTYTPICINPGTSEAECKVQMKQELKDSCKEYEKCLEGCYTCIYEDEKKCPDPEDL